MNFENSTMSNFYLLMKFDIDMNSLNYPTAKIRARKKDQVVAIPPRR